MKSCTLVKKDEFSCETKGDYILKHLLPIRDGNESTVGTIRPAF
jgi:hypothetical protein